MKFISSDALRDLFSAAMSSMYRHEVPQYSKLLSLVSTVNQLMLQNNTKLKESLQQTNNLSRISKEKHGAIRIGKAEELFILRRLFKIMGMFPVAYYDLSIAGIPVHSTAFRPIEKAALSANPFRIFTSLLRIELITDQDLRQQTEAILADRNIFPENLIHTIEKTEQQGGLSVDEAEHFIDQVIDVFRWHDTAQIDETLYQRLHANHPLIADVVSFKGPHINHLTPSTLDIDLVQLGMPEHRITPKAIIEGPPKRNCPILLRQTAFKALEEAVNFPNHENGYTAGTHTARFGEVEQRGIALTDKGMRLYNEKLSIVRQHIIPKADGSNAEEYRQQLENVFKTFPDNYDELRQSKLAYFSYSLVDSGVNKSLGKGKSLEELLAHKLVRFDPILYEDFLPVSAAGIFQSNLHDTRQNTFHQESNVSEFEHALGSSVFDPFKLYESQQEESIHDCLAYFSDN